MQTLPSLWTFEDMAICPDMPNFHPSISVALRFTTLKDADATAPQTAVTRASVCAESPGFGNMKLSLLYIRIDSEMGWSETQTPSLLCVVYYLYILDYIHHSYIHVYTYVMIYYMFDLTSPYRPYLDHGDLQRHVALDLDLLIGEVPWNTNPIRWKKPRSRKISFVKHPSSFLTCEDCGE